jgi:hypothetical protein
MKARFFERSGYYTRTIAFGAAQELAGDERHHARDACTGFQYLMRIGLDP